MERLFGISVIDLPRLGMLIKHHWNNQKNQERDRDSSCDGPVMIRIKLIIKDAANHQNVTTPKEVGDHKFPGCRNKNQ